MFFHSHDIIVLNPQRETPSAERLVSRVHSVGPSGAAIEGWRWQFCNYRQRWMVLELGRAGGDDYWLSRLAVVERRFPEFRYITRVMIIYRSEADNNVGCRMAAKFRFFGVVLWGLAKFWESFGKVGRLGIHL